MSKLTSLITASALIAIGGVNTASARTHAAMIAKDLPPLMEQFKITSPLRIEHMLAQMAEESDHWKADEEYASGRAYEGRHDLGNIRPGDGMRFKGRGWIELTGRANYRKFTAWIRQYVPDAPDFEQEPEKVSESPWSSWSAIYYWETHGLSSLADRDDLRGITKAVNGGYNGLAERGRMLARAKSYFAKAVGDSIAVAQGAPVLHRGCMGAEVGDLQECLKTFGLYHLAIDEDFGPGTEGAVIAFQKSKGLKPDGIVGKLTRAALGLGKA